MKGKKKRDNEPNIIVTICARGGSKGVPNKNIRKLAGKPLIAHTVEIAKEWGKADRIVCSTDSEKIARAAKKYGAEVPFVRQKKLATDRSGKVAVIRDALRRCEALYEETYDVVVDMDVTNPLRRIADLDECLKIFKKKNADIVITAVEARRSPYFTMVELDKNGFAHLSKKIEDVPLRRQDSPRVYDMNGSIYFYKRETLLNENFNHPICSGRVALHVMDEMSAFDVDSEMDFKFVEFIMKNLIKDKGKSINERSLA